MHLAPACTFWLAVGMFAVEWPAMRENGALLLMVHRPFLYLTGRPCFTQRRPPSPPEQPLLVGVRHDLTQWLL